MANLGNYNANDYDPAAAFEPLPEGEYLVAITDSAIKLTKAGNGKYAQFEFTVMDGDLKGRKVWDRLCIEHPKAKAQKIARERLSAICHAVGVLEPGDTVNLHNLPLLAKVAVKRRDDNGELTNEIKGYRPKEAVKAKSAPKAPASSGGAGAAPWKREG